MTALVTFTAQLNSNSGLIPCPALLKYQRRIAESTCAALQMISRYVWNPIDPTTSPEFIYLTDIWERLFGYSAPEDRRTGTLIGLRAADPLHTRFQADN